MPNMSYCQFELTYQDLQNCAENINETEKLSETEKYYRNKLIKLCKNIVDSQENNKKDFIDDFNKKSLFVKCRILNMAEKYKTEIFDLHKEILKEMYNEGRGHKVISVIGNIAIIENTSNFVFLKEHFTASVKINDKWISIANYYSSVDQTLLGALEYKYFHHNASFTYFASRMLGINNNE